MIGDRWLEPVELQLRLLREDGSLASRTSNGAIAAVKVRILAVAVKRPVQQQCCFIAIIRHESARFSCTVSLENAPERPQPQPLRPPALDGADLYLRENWRPASAWQHSRRHPQGRKWCPGPQESSLSMITERELQHVSPWPSPKDRKQRLVLLSSRSFAPRYSWLRYLCKKPERIKPVPAERGQDL